MKFQEMSEIEEIQEFREELLKIKRIRGIREALSNNLKELEAGQITVKAWLITANSLRKQEQNLSETSLILG